jgi:hypothetical protein
MVARLHVNLGSLWIMIRGRILGHSTVGLVHCQEVRTPHLGQLPAERLPSLATKWGRKAVMARLGTLCDRERVDLGPEIDLDEVIDVPIEYILHVSPFVSGAMVLHHAIRVHHV